VEQEGLEGLCHFTNLHYHAPFVITTIAFALGLMGIASLWNMWKGVNSAIRLLAVMATLGGCLFNIQTAYANRHRLRETELLKQWRIAKRKAELRVQLRAQWKAMLMPVIVIGLILLLTYALVKFEDLWKLANWLLFEREEEEAPEEREAGETPVDESADEKESPPVDDIRVRVKRTIPLVSLIWYVGVCLALTYSSSLALAGEYAERMNQELPHPIFWQDEKLAMVVRREAEIELGRRDPEVFRQDNPEFENVSMMAYAQQLGRQTDPQHLLLPANVGRQAAGADQASAHGQRWYQIANWVWDELERTDEGGIKMRIAREEIYQLPKSAKDSGYIPHTRVSYTVCADPWGRITEIKRDGK